MLERRRVLLAIAPLFTAGATAVSANQKYTGSPQGASSSKPKSVEAGEEYCKKLLLLMDTDKNGKVSKKEFMAFMEAEFNRLDTNHDGELDVKELAKIRVPPYVGK